MRRAAFVLALASALLLAQPPPPMIRQGTVPLPSGVIVLSLTACPAGFTSVTTIKGLALTGQGSIFYCKKN